jgi:hypothetical protein
MLKALLMDVQHGQQRIQHVVACNMWQMPCVCCAALLTSY